MTLLLDTISAHAPTPHPLGIYMALVFRKTCKDIAPTGN